MGDSRCTRLSHLRALNDRALVMRLRVRALITRPAIIGTGETTIDFLPRVPTHGAEIGFVRSRVQVESKGVAHTIRPDLRSVRTGSVVERIVSRRRAIIVDAQDL